jgi:hypothetical protein
MSDWTAMISITFTQTASPCTRLNDTSRPQIPAIVLDALAMESSGISWIMMKSLGRFGVKHAACSEPTEITHSPKGENGRIGSGLSANRYAPYAASSFTGVPVSTFVKVHQQVRSVGTSKSSTYPSVQLVNRQREFRRIVLTGVRFSLSGSIQKFGLSIAPILRSLSAPLLAVDGS